MKLPIMESLISWYHYKLPWRRKIKKEKLKAKEDYEKLKKEIEGIEKESCTSTTSEITDPESAISDNSNDECGNRPLFLSNSGS